MKKKIVTIVLTTLVGLLLTMVSPSAASPYFAIGADRWQDALDDNLNEGTITGMTSSDWDDYMLSWQTPDEGDPYPPNTYYVPNLSVYPGASSFPTTDINKDGIINIVEVAYVAGNWLSDGLDLQPHSYPEYPGLVMAWGPPNQDPCESTSSAWVFKYGEDPCLTDTVITISVYPTTGVNLVSFGLEDVVGKRMAWYWDVGAGGLRSSQNNLLIIDTAFDGIAATTPPASAFMKDTGFQLDYVVLLIADENNEWRQPIQVPPPGETVAKAWNFWSNLTVSPRPRTPQEERGHYKWRQPAKFVGSPAAFWGWDEVSIDFNPPLLADDFVCIDNRPITGINWWGSFRIPPILSPGGLTLGGWLDATPPDPEPTGFKIGIWTDVPGHLQNLLQYSHPGTMIWEQTCTDYDRVFVGYDVSPATAILPPVVPMPPFIAPPIIPIDACFQFSCDLDPNFIQDPNSNNVYWLSIGAIYDDPNQVVYEWGWKTRPHYCNDGAIRITGTVGTEWPPTVGSQYAAGTTVERPLYTPWDLAFELVTDRSQDQYTLCPASSSGGSVTAPGEDGTYRYEPGKVVNLVAVSDVGYHFVNWTRDTENIADPNSPTTTITMRDNYIIVANFAIDRHDLDPSSTGGGSVTNPGEAVYTYNYGTVVDLVAVSNVGYHFVNWTGETAGIANVNAAATTVTMQNDYAIVANFVIDQHDLDPSSTVGGSVTVPGEAVYTYNYGTVVNLVAVSDVSYHFVNWTGETAGIANVNAAATTVTMQNDYAIVANFLLD